MQITNSLYTIEITKKKIVLHVSFFKKYSPCGYGVLEFIKGLLLISNANAKCVLGGFIFQRLYVFIVDKLLQCKREIKVKCVRAIKFSFELSVNTTTEYIGGGGEERT